MSILINETLAKSIAEKMSNKMYDEKIQSLDNKIFNLVSSIVSISIPKKVLAFCSTHKGYCNWYNTVTLSDETDTLYGLKCKSYPFNRNMSSEGKFIVSTKVMSYLKELIHERNSINKKKSELEFRISGIILSFKTIGQVRVNFPEAYSYIDEALGYKPIPTPEILEVRKILNTKESD